MRWIILAVLASVAAACGQPPTQPAATAPPVEAQQPTATAPAPAAQQSQPATPGAPPQNAPAPGPPPRFVGLWAANQNLCAQPAVRFTATDVSTQGGVHCAFNRILPVGTGYSIQATCTAEGPPAPYDMEIEFADAQHATIVGGPWAHANLVYCGPLPSN